MLKLEPLPEKTTSVLEEEKPKSSWEALKKMVKPSMDKFRLFSSFLSFSFAFEGFFFLNVEL